MYHTITPVTGDHAPVIIEQSWASQVIIFNAGPGTIKAQIWTEWSGKINNVYPENAEEPNYSLELRAGNEKIVGGAFVRISLKKSQDEVPFAAVGTRIIDNDQFYIAR